ncbi:MAG: hypothetical protein LUF91_07515 [Oscillospiraceae bacterium]|nr:hypothetical protein [Oscillospiraceae bacterium]
MISCFVSLNFPRDEAFFIPKIPRQHRMITGCGVLRKIPARTALQQTWAAPRSCVCIAQHKISRHPLLPGFAVKSLKFPVFTLCSAENFLRNPLLPRDVPPPQLFLNMEESETWEEPSKFLTPRYATESSLPDAA